MQSLLRYHPSAKAILGRLGLSPKKALGQHFLVGQGVVSNIMKAADIQPQEMVVEIGPGLGIVTIELMRRSTRVVAVELDNQLALALKRELEPTGLKVVCADARVVDVAELTGGEPYKLVANLPYYAASPILRRFLESRHPPVRAVVMVQREVAKNMVALPGGMSLMSVGVQLYGLARIAGYVPPSAFYPKPKVTSAIVCIDVYQQPAVALEDRKEFFAIVRAGFSAPRKQLRNALAHGLGILPGEAQDLLETAGIDPKRRAETLSIQAWGALYSQVQKRGVHASSRLHQG